MTGRVIVLNSEETTMNRSSQIIPSHRPPRGLKALRPVGVLGLLCLAHAGFSAASAQGTPPAPPTYPNMAPVAQYLYADQATEIALARSAAPKSISDKATVLTLGKNGYETAVKGSNGFVCLVGRPWAGDFDAQEFWNPDIHQPQCWNATAARSVLPDYLERTQWVLAGVSKDEMLARTKAAVAANEIPPPAPGSMVYMLSKEQYIVSTQGHWYPHIMFFVPATDGSPWGANSPGSLIYSQTSNVEPITTYFILAPRWSDGTLGPYAAALPEEHHH